MKTSDAKAPRVRISASPPFLYLNTFLNSEKYSRGRRGAPAKGVGRESGARVQISPSPPHLGVTSVTPRLFFCPSPTNSSFVGGLKL